MCDPVDAYVERMSHMRVSEEPGGGRVSGSRPEAQVPVSRSGSGTLHRIIDSSNFLDGDNLRQHSQQPPPEYKITYERFSSPKPAEQQQIQSRGQQAPVYENVDYYPQNISLPSHPPYYHPVETRNSPRSSPRGSVAGDAYEPTSFRKAQPQVPPGSRYQSSASPGAKELPPYEAPPVYENIQEVHGAFNDNQTSHIHNQQRQQQLNKPCPQVANFYNPVSMEGGDYVVMTGKIVSTQQQQQQQRSIGNQNRSLSYDAVSIQRGSGSGSDSQGLKNAYVPPSELHLQSNRSYAYSPEQHSPRTNNHHSTIREQGESPPVRSIPDNHQSNYKDNNEVSQHNYRHTQSLGDQAPPNYRASPNFLNNQRSVSVAPINQQTNYEQRNTDLKTRNSPPVYPSRSNRHHSENLLLARNNSPSSYSSVHSARPDSQLRASPKASPTTHPQIHSSEPLTQNSVGQSRFNSQTEVVPPSPVRGQVQPAVTSASQPVKDETALHRPRITSLPPGVTSGVAGPVYLSGGVPQLQKTTDVRPETPKSITPPIKPAPGKGLLPYNVTPPRPSVSIYLFT